METLVQCLMIKTKDKRKFFTFEKNYVQLLEFSKMFNAEISIVKAKDVEVLDLPQLAPAICNANYMQPPPSILQIIEVKLPQNKKSRDNILKTAKMIKDYITESFLDNKVISLKDLYKKYAGEGLTLACICNHLSKVRHELEEKGHRVEKLGGGKYLLARHL
jgi:hypothetical protein